ncbi:MAG TPA: hypothetical protein VKU00_08790 [Chthonomonadaceae bacterium]|nr:hypothetical protein [Chthonomonadaceae bacterium]
MNVERARYLLTPAMVFALGVMLSGCGGGGGSAGDASVTEQTLQVGPLITRASGVTQPPITAGRNSSTGGTQENLAASFALDTPFED